MGRPVFKIEVVCRSIEGMHGISGLGPVEINRCKTHPIPSHPIEIVRPASCDGSPTRCSTRQRFSKTDPESESHLLRLTPPRSPTYAPTHSNRSDHKKQSANGDAGGGAEVRACVDAWVTRAYIYTHTYIYT